MRLDDAVGQLVATLQTDRPSAAMPPFRGGDLGVGRRQTRAKTLAQLIWVVRSVPRQLQQHRHRSVKMATCPAIGGAEMGRALVKRCKGSAPPADNGTQTQLSRLA